VPVSDNGAVVPESRFRTNQADDKFANRHGIRVGKAQREIAETVDRYGRVGKEGSNHTSHRDYGSESDRRRSAEVDQDSLRTRRGIVLDIRVGISKGRKVSAPLILF